jgi:hypothetical protein
MKILNADPEFVRAKKKRSSELMKRLHADPKFKQAIKDGNKKINLDPKFVSERIVRGREIMKKNRANPEFVKKNLESREKLYSDHEYIQSMSKRMKGRWANPEVSLKMLSAIKLSPNKIEINFYEHFKDKIKFTGDRQLWITFDVKYTSGGKAGKFIHKNPDFKVNGQKKVIELYGDYWHQNDDPLELMINYRNAGYKCLIFWEYDVKNHMNEVIELTNLFIDAESEEDWKIVEDKQFEFLARAEAYLKEKKAKKQRVLTQAS